MAIDETKPIVCGTDFSQNAVQAARVADALARRLDTPLILARSADERGEFPEHLRRRRLSDDRPRLADHAERLRGLGLACTEKLLRGLPKAKGEVEMQLRALVPAAAEEHGVTTAVRIAESDDPAKAICETAERFGADLVCIGSHGRGGLAATVLGSVAQTVMAHSPHPVLVVRP